MGLRFQRRIQIVPGLHLNLSKSGIGVSVGGKGLTLSAGPRGVRGTASIPGTGLSFTHRLHAAQFGVGVRGAGFDDEARTESLPEWASQLPKQSTWSLIWLFAFWPVYILSFVWPSQVSARCYNAALKDLKYGRTEEAVVNFRRSVESNAENDSARRLLVLFLIEAESYREAHDNAVILASQHPSVAPYWAAVVALLGKLQRSREVPLVIAKAPSDPEVVACGAQVLLEGGLLDEVIALAQKSPHLQDETYGETIRLALALAFVGKKKWEIASEVLKKGPVSSRTRTDRVLTEYRYWLGICYFNLEDRDRAREQFSKVYADDISYRDVAAYLERLL